jgi:hypothetical protein
MAPTISASSLDGLVVADLDLHAAPRCEFWDNHRVSYLLEDGWVGLAPQPVVVGVEVCSGNDERKMDGLMTLRSATDGEGAKIDEHH